MLHINLADLAGGTWGLEAVHRISEYLMDALEGMENIAVIS